MDHACLSFRLGLTAAGSSTKSLCRGLARLLPSDYTVPAQPDGLERSTMQTAPDTHLGQRFAATFGGTLHDY